MGKSRHSEAQITAALKQLEAGRAAEEVARDCVVSKHTIYGSKPSTAAQTSVKPTR